MSDLPQIFRVPKATGTHADVFAAVGLAELLASMPGQSGVRLIERDADFEVRPVDPLNESMAARTPQVPGYAFLQVVKKERKIEIPSGAVDPVDYEAEKAKADRRREAYSRARKEGAGQTLDSETREAMQREQAREDWRLLQILNVLKGVDRTNEMHTAIVSRNPAKFREELVASLIAVSGGASTGVSWVRKPGFVQLFTPTAAKGYSLAKPAGTDRNDKTKDKSADAFMEWLRYRGYFDVACPFFQGPKAEDVHVLCPVPREVSVQALHSLARELRGRGIHSGAVTAKMDALVVLRLAEMLVRHSQEYHLPGIEAYPGLSLRGRSPYSVISGITVTHYQKASRSAKSVSAISTLALPGWFSLETKEDAEALLEILSEHQSVIGGLNPRDRETPPRNDGDEVDLLVAYRRFLAGRGQEALWALIEFMGRYGPFLIRARRQGRRVRAFGVDPFRRIIMGTNPSFAEILDNPGFQAVARAIRHMTVSAQYWEGQAKKDPRVRHREIRYELLPDLRRKRDVPGSAFVEAVSHYVDLFNAENAKQREREEPEWCFPARGGEGASRGYVHYVTANVSTQQLADFVALVDRRRAPLVGALLCAYGSCRESRDNEAGRDTDEEPGTDGLAEPEDG